MCEIFCFNSNKAKQVNESLKCFYEHSDEHPHGWGLVNIQNNEFTIDKEPLKANNSQYLKDLLHYPIVGKNIFAHIRLATVGENIFHNCQPFTQSDGNNRLWMLIHNGTIFDYPKLDKYKEKEKGNTDSERILLFIIDKINEFEHNKGGLSTIKERFILLNGLIADLSKNNKLNLMIYDGDLTYIHSNTKDSLYYLKNEDSFLISSTPLNNDESWKNVEINKLFALIDGNIIFESKAHENEFIFTLEHEKAIEDFLNTLKQDGQY